MCDGKAGKAGNNNNRTGGGWRGPATPGSNAPGGLLGPYRCALDTRRPIRPDGPAGPHVYVTQTPYGNGALGSGASFYTGWEHVTKLLQ